MTDDEAQFWYGNISVGTPGVSFTGTIFLHDSRTGYLILDTIQWTSIPEAAISSCPRRNADGAAQGTDCITRMRVRLRDLLKTFSLAYEDGTSVMGEQYIDVVSIAGLTV